MEEKRIIFIKLKKNTIKISLLAQISEEKTLILTFILWKNNLKESDKKLHFESLKNKIGKIKFELNSIGYFCVGKNNIYIIKE